MLWTLMCASPTTELLCMFSKSYNIQPFIKASMCHEDRWTLRDSCIK